MNELVQASLRAPTVGFTIGLGIALVYWLFVLVGALDLDVFAHKVDGIKIDHGGVAEALGIGTVPITITISLTLFVGWVTSIGLQSWLGWAVLPIALVVALVATVLLARPLAPVFAVREGKSNRDYIGATCVVSTGRVDDGFGQATLEDGGTVLLIPVRCDRPGVLARGDRALVIDFDERRQAYVVEPVGELAREETEV